MRIDVYGLGYVGCVSAVCLANDGHLVRGVDINPEKVRAINQGRSPIIEPGLEEALRDAVSTGNLVAAEHGSGNAEIFLISVGTPSNENGSLNLEYLKKVGRDIGQALKESGVPYPVVVNRSTVLPGTISSCLVPLLERTSGRKAGRDLGVCMNPEFMREGTSLEDFYHPPFTVIGADDKRSTELVERIYEKVKAPIYRTSLAVAEMLKYACNAFHGLKVAFANEIGNVCQACGIDGQKVMEIFCRDTKLNLSPYYLKPGFAFGGSCLPKDVRALTYYARQHDLETPVLSAVLPSNREQINRALLMIERTGSKHVGILGLSFKAGSDDLRESPMIELAERLLGKGYNLSIFDREVSMARIFGSNKRYIERAIPHISSLMRDSVEEVVGASEVVVLGKRDRAWDRSDLFTDKQVIDLVRIVAAESAREYQGICW